MKRRIDFLRDSRNEEERNPDDENSSEGQRKSKEHNPTYPEFAPAAWLLLKVVVGVGGIAMVMNPAHIWGEEPLLSAPSIFERADSINFGSGEHDQLDIMPGHAPPGNDENHQQLRGIAPRLVDDPAASAAADLDVDGDTAAAKGPNTATIEATEGDIRGVGDGSAGAGTAAVDGAGGPAGNLAASAGRSDEKAGHGPQDQLLVPELDRLNEKQQQQQQHQVDQAPSEGAVTAQPKSASQAAPEQNGRGEQVDRAASPLSGDAAGVSPPEVVDKAEGIGGGVGDARAADDIAPAAAAAAPAVPNSVGADLGVLANLAEPQIADAEPAVPLLGAAGLVSRMDGAASLLTADHAAKTLPGTASNDLRIDDAAIAVATTPQLAGGTTTLRENLPQAYPGQQLPPQGEATAGGQEQPPSGAATVSGKDEAIDNTAPLSADPVTVPLPETLGDGRTNTAASRISIGASPTVPENVVQPPAGQGETDPLLRDANGVPERDNSVNPAAKLNPAAADAPPVSVVAPVGLLGNADVAEHGGGGGDGCGDECGCGCRGGGGDGSGKPVATAPSPPALPAAPVLPADPLPLDESGLKDGAAVWSWLQEAPASRELCASTPCDEGKHMLADDADLADEMLTVRGAVVVKRPELTQRPGILAPANGLNFAETLRSYFPVFTSSLLPGPMLGEKVRHLPEVEKVGAFLDAVREGSDTAGKYLSAYYVGPGSKPTTRISKDDGYETAPTLIGLADVFINPFGHVWNEKNYLVPKSCEAAVFGGPSEKLALPTNAERYEKVFVITQHWGDAYSHFLSESLPRVTLMLDALLANPEIKIAMHAPPAGESDRKHYMAEFMALLGIHEERLVFMNTEIHADLAILPESTACEKPNTGMVNMLRSALLKGMYPNTLGVPPATSRPVILLIVRQLKGGLANNDQVREALEAQFPKYDVVESFSHGPVLEQLSAFATADVIVAPHMEGLSSMIASPLHTPVLEIGPPGCSAEYMQLALKLQHIYARHLGFSGTDSIGADCDSPYEPNVEEITDLVRNLLEAKKQADTADPPTTANAGQGAGRASIRLTTAAHSSGGKSQTISNGLSPPPASNAGPLAGTPPGGTPGTVGNGSRRLRILPLAGKWAETAHIGSEASDRNPLGGVEGNGSSPSEAHVEERRRQHQQEKAIYNDDRVYEDDLYGDEDAGGDDTKDVEGPTGPGHDFRGGTALRDQGQGEQLAPLIKDEALAERRNEGLTDERQHAYGNWHSSFSDDDRMLYEDSGEFSDTSYVVVDRGSVEMVGGGDLPLGADDDQVFFRVRRKPVPSRSQGEPYEPPAHRFPSDKRVDSKELVGETDHHLDKQSANQGGKKRSAAGEGGESKPRRREDRRTDKPAQPQEGEGGRDMFAGGGGEAEDDYDSGWNSDDDFFIHVAHYSRTAGRGKDELPTASGASVAARKERTPWNFGTLDGESDTVTDEGGRSGLAQKETSAKAVAAAAAIPTHGDEASRWKRNVGPRHPSPAGTRSWERLQGRKERRDAGRGFPDHSKEMYPVGSTRTHAWPGAYNGPDQDARAQQKESGQNRFRNVAGDHGKSRSWGGLDFDLLANKYKQIPDDRQQEVARVEDNQTDWKENEQVEEEEEEQKSSAEPYMEYFAYVQEMQGYLSAVHRDDPFAAQHGGAASSQHHSPPFQRRTKKAGQNGRLDVVTNDALKDGVPREMEGNAEDLHPRVRSDGQGEGHYSDADQGLETKGSLLGKTEDEGTHVGSQFFSAVPGTVEVSRKLRGGKAGG